MGSAFTPWVPLSHGPPHPPLAGRAKSEASIAVAPRRRREGGGGACKDANGYSRVFAGVSAALT
jgi:hypothetical protein